MTLNEKAAAIAKADYQVNGVFMNQPHSIVHEGERYIVRIHSDHNRKIGVKSWRMIAQLRFYLMIILT